MSETLDYAHTTLFRLSSLETEIITVTCIFHNRCEIRHTHATYIYICAFADPPKPYIFDSMLKSELKKNTKERLVDTELEFSGVSLVYIVLHYFISFDSLVPPPFLANATTLMLNLTHHN